MKKVMWCSLGAVLIGGAVGCGAPGEEGALLQDDPISQGIKATNGLRAINGLRATNGLVATNGLRTTNGLATTNGLRTTNGLVSNEGLMTNSDGRATVSYLARCALASGDYFDKQDNYGNWHRYYGALGVGTSYKDNSCDSACQQRISACMMAHMNSTGANVPIFINADPDKMPSVGMSKPDEAGSDAHTMEGVFFGNVLASNPPEAYYVKGDGFKASIPGRLGASSDNPYKAWGGYRPDESGWYSGIAEKLCMPKFITNSDQYFDYKECGKSDSAYGTWKTYWPNVMTTYVDRNYNGSVTQNWSQQTLNFEGDSIGNKTNSRADVWTTSHNFEFKNTVNMYSTGKTYVESVNGSKRLCSGNNNEHIVISKNSGEPFSLANLKMNIRWQSGGQSHMVKIKGFVRGSSTARWIDVWLSNGSVSTIDVNWDNLAKVELRMLNAIGCIDDVVLKT